MVGGCKSGPKKRSLMITRSDHRASQYAIQGGAHRISPGDLIECTPMLYIPYSSSMTEENTDAAIAELSEELRTAIGTFVRATRSRSDSLPQSRAETLGYLERSGPQSMRELAVSRGVSHQTVSRMVRELEQLGFVSRSSNPDDARGFFINISAVGESALNADRNARRDRIGAAIAEVLSTDDRHKLQQLPEMLNRLSEAISAQT